MNENGLLIGTPVNATVFIVDYQYTKPPRKSKLPKTAKPEVEKVQNRAIICSSDPSGRDVFEITKRAVLGANPYEESDFRILQQQRAFDAIGTASVTTWDKFDGSAPEETGIIDADDDDGSDDDGNEPPISNLN